MEPGDRRQRPGDHRDDVRQPRSRARPRVPFAARHHRQTGPDLRHAARPCIPWRGDSGSPGGVLQHPCNREPDPARGRPGAPRFPRRLVRPGADATVRRVPRGEDMRRSALWSGLRTLSSRTFSTVRAAMRCSSKTICMAVLESSSAEPAPIIALATRVAALRQRAAALEARARAGPEPVGLPQ